MEEKQEIESDIKFIRLVTGEDIMSDIKEDGDNYILSNPLRVLYTSDSVKENALSISFMQWIFDRISENQKFTIPKNSVIIAIPPSDGLVDYYLTSLDYFDLEHTKQKHKKKKINVDYLNLVSDEELLGEKEKEVAAQMIREYFGNNKRKLH